MLDKIRKARNALGNLPTERALLGILLLGLAWSVWSFWAEDRDSKTSTLSEDFPLEADDLIPDGYVLLPVEFENQAALNPLLGSFGLLNIYASEGPEGKRGRLVARQVKVIRSPQQPDALAVLVPETQAGILTGGGRGLYGVVQRKKSEARFQSPPRHRPLEVESFENNPGGSL